MGVEMAYREVRGKLGIFGWLFRIAFWGWQLLMLVWFLSYTSNVAPLVQGVKNEWEKAGAGAGIAIAWGMILFFWVGGSIILGLFVLMTRPARMLVQTDQVSR